MSEFTPGPWKIEEEDYGDELWFGGRGCGLIRVNGWANGGCKDKPDEWASMKAEARLIAAAPVLYKALQAIADQEQHDDDAETHMHDMADIARAALRKARGE